MLPRSVVQRWKQQEEPTGPGARVCRGRVEDRESGVYMKQIRSHLPMDFSTSYQGVFQGEACEALTLGSVLKEAPEMQSGKGVTF